LILFAWLFFQLLVFINFQVSSKLIANKDGYLYSEKGQQPKWLQSWANFDGIHYLQIAQRGYGLYQQAFFPFYPKLIGFIGKILAGQYLLAGFLISSISLLGVLYLLYNLVLLDWSKEEAIHTIFFLVLFPTSFFFTAVYTESIFLFLTLLAFYWARKRLWLLVPLAIALASATRLVGIFLIPALLFELWQQQKRGQKLKVGYLFLSLWLILISPLGLVSYMKYLSNNYQDSLMFVHVQSNFGAQRSGGKMVLLYQVFWRYLKMVISCQKNSLVYFNVWFELLSALLFLALLILAYFKKVNYSYLIFAFFAYLIPTLTGTLSSFPRYVLVLFPAFIGLSLFHKEHPLIGKIFSFILFILLFICQFLFSQGYWVG